MLNVLSKFFAVLVLLLLLIVASGGISQKSRWKIIEIRISGNAVVSGDALASSVHRKLQGNYFFVYARANSFLFPRREIEAGLMGEFARLKSVAVRRFDAHTIVVDVLERKPFMLWCGEVFEPAGTVLADCWFVDEDGFIFDRAPVFSDGVYREVYATLARVENETPLRGVIPSPRFLFARSVGEGVERELGDVSRVFIKPEGEYGIVIRSSARYPALEGAEVRFKEAQSAERLIQNLLSALLVEFPAGQSSSKKLLYIDLRFGNKVFFGFED